MWHSTPSICQYHSVGLNSLQSNVFGADIWHHLQTVQGCWILEIELGMSLINTKNGRRPMIDPWGTLDKLAKDDRSSGMRYTEQKNLVKQCRPV